MHFRYRHHIILIDRSITKLFLWHERRWRVWNNFILILLISLLFQLNFFSWRGFNKHVDHSTRITKIMNYYDKHVIYYNGPLLCFKKLRLTAYRDQVFKVDDCFYSIFKKSSDWQTNYGHSRERIQREQHPKNTSLRGGQLWRRSGMETNIIKELRNAIMKLE